jgi:hypothetical protein
LPTDHSIPLGLRYQPSDVLVAPQELPFSIPNRWRTLALQDGKAHRVLTYMMWLYCDDTSGNRSKKWNEHNSFLFIPAGLPITEAQRESNIRFICTSNIAPPVELMEGVVDEIKSVLLYLTCII